MNTSILDMSYKTIKRKTCSFLHKLGTNPSSVDHIFNTSIYQAWTVLNNKPEYTEQELTKLTLSIAYKRRVDDIRSTLRYTPIEEHHHNHHTDTYFEQTPQQFIQQLKPLNDTQKQIMFMSYWYGYPNQQIADKLNMTNAAVRVTKTRSIKQLAETYKS